MSNVISVLYNITWKCNLKCKYCYVHGSDSGCRDMSETDVRKDIEQLVRWAQDNDLQYNFYLHGGEPLLRSEHLKYIFSRMIPLSVGVIGLQTNLTQLDAATIFLLRMYSDQVRLSTSLDLPKAQHDAHRCGSYDKVYANILRCLDAGIKVNVLSGFHRYNCGEPARLADAFVAVEQPGLTLRLAHIVAPDYTASPAQQEALLDYFIANGLERFLPAAQFMFGSCEFSQYCSIFSYSHGKFGLCNKLAGEVWPEARIIEKRVPDECQDCKVVAVCNGGCIADRIAAGTAKTPMCVHNKKLINLYGGKPCC